MTTRIPPLIKSVKSTKLKKKITKHSVHKKKKKARSKQAKAQAKDSSKKATSHTKVDMQATSILDPAFFDADVIPKKTTMGFSKLLTHARMTILELLKIRDYRPCLALLTALIETCKFKTLAYWKVGEEIIRNCRPEDLSVFLESVVSGIRAPKNVPAWKEQLVYILNEEGYTAFMEKVESSIEKRDDNQSIVKLLALVKFEAWERMTKKNQDDISKPYQLLLYDTEEHLSKAYHLNPADRYVIRAYLKVLSAITKISNGESVSNVQHRRQSISKQVSNAAFKIKEVVDTTLQMQINDPELLCILLYYGSQGLDNEMDLSIAMCSEDPVADARIKFLPTMKSMKSVLETDSDYLTITMARAELILERLEHGVTETCTLDELDQLLDDIENGPQHAKYNVMLFFAVNNLPITLDNLQLGVHDDDINALDTLEFLKFKVIEMIPAH